MKYTTKEEVMPATATCTVGPHAVTGERCGKPAVYTFTTAYGETFAECAEHCTHARGTVTVVPIFTVGEAVTVEHVGITKGGIVVKVMRTAAMVEVMIGRGATRRPKVIRRRFEEITKAAF